MYNEFIGYCQKAGLTANVSKTKLRVITKRGR